MRTLFLSLFALLFLCHHPSAMAASAASNRQAMEKAAKKACILGDFRKGADLLAELFVETNDPNYIFNQGRCFEQSHQWEDAADRFLEFLRKMPNLSEDERKDVEKHIAECQSHLPNQAAPSARSPQAPLPAVPPPPPASSIPETNDSTSTPAPALATDEHAGAGLRVSGIVLGAVGVVGLATGIICNIRHESLVKDVNAGTASRGSLDTYRTASWVGYGVGAAALVTGVTLYILGAQAAKTGSKPSSVALLPVFRPGESTLLLSGAF
jgi:hypothetical protein